MDWDQKQQNPLPSSSEDHSQLNNNGGGGGGTFVKVMTDEQMEVLRKQIAVYATICEQLVELHKSLTAHNDLAAGVRLGNIYCDPLIASSAHKIGGRQRWTPTPTQLQILERMFEQGIGTPSKNKIKEITSELSQHGQISETNVYNWFQNRRARSKRKQQTAQSNNNNGESEVETEVESPGHEKKTKQFDEEGFVLRREMMGSKRRDDNASSAFKDPQIVEDSMFGGDFDQMGLYGSMLLNPRTDHMIAKLEVDGSFSSYIQQQQSSNHDYNIA